MSNYRVERHIYKLDTAIKNKVVHVFGNYIQVVKASSLNAAIGVEMAGDNLKVEGELELRNVDLIRVPQPFSRVYLSWEAQAGEWVEIIFMTQDPAPAEFEYVRQERGVIDSIANTVSVLEKPSASFATGQVTLNTSGVKIVNADPTRKKLSITNTNTGTSVYITAAQVTSAGHLLSPLATIDLDTTAEVWGYTLASTATVTTIAQ